MTISHVLIATIILLFLFNLLGLFGRRMVNTEACFIGALTFVCVIAAINLIRYYLHTPALAQIKGVDTYGCPQLSTVPIIKQKRISFVFTDTKKSTSFSVVGLQKSLTKSSLSPIAQTELNHTYGNPQVYAIPASKCKGNSFVLPLALLFFIMFFMLVLLGFVFTDTKKSTSFSVVGLQSALSQRSLSSATQTPVDLSKFKTVAEAFPYMTEAQQDRAIAMLKRMNSATDEKDPEHEKWQVEVSGIIQQLDVLYKEFILTNEKTNGEIGEINKELSNIKHFCAKALLEGDDLWKEPELVRSLHIIAEGCKVIEEKNQLWVRMNISEITRLKKEQQNEVVLSQQLLEDSKWVYSAAEKEEEIPYLRDSLSRLEEDTRWAVERLQLTFEAKKKFFVSTHAFLENYKANTNELINVMSELEKVIPFSGIVKKKPKEEGDLVGWQQEVSEEFEAINKLERELIKNRAEFLKKIKEVREDLEEGLEEERGFWGKAVRKVLCSKTYVRLFRDKTIIESALIVAAIFALIGGVILLPLLGIRAES